MTRSRAFVGLVALVALLAVACDNGDTVIQGPGAGPVGISVQGTGTATGTPDVALLQIGVEVEAATVEAARSQAASAQDAVITSLKANGVAEKDIQTLQLSIQPQYDTQRPTPLPGTPTGPITQVIRGYRVVNTVAVKVRDLSKVSKTLDDAVRAGGNATVVRGISFSIDDQTKLMAEAREKAVKDAKARAADLALHSGVSLGRLLTIAESGGFQPVPYLAARATGAQDSATPVQPGELEIVVNVSAIWAID